MERASTCLNIAATAVLAAAVAGAIALLVAANSASPSGWSEVMSADPMSTALARAVILLIGAAIVSLTMIGIGLALDAAVRARQRAEYRKAAMLMPPVWRGVASMPRAS